MTRKQAAIRLAHILGIGVIPAYKLVLRAQYQSPGTHAWETNR